VLSVVLLLALGAIPAVADDWIAQRLRGRVLEQVDGEWRVVARGDAVSDTHAIRTGGNGRVLLVRGTETVELGPDTLVEIIDRDGQQFTTVKQAFGVVTVEADVRNVEHFAVETPYLAAVVKGTIFIVRSGKSGAQVEVERGHVAVESTSDHSSTVVSAGQWVVAEDGVALEVGGFGALPVVLEATDQSGASAARKQGKSDDAGSNSVNGNLDKGEAGNGRGRSDEASGNSGNSSHGNSGNGGGNSGNGNADEDDNS